MKISIITVCYNSAATIRDAVNSVLGQQGVTLEYIVIDGQSSDDTMAILKSYGKRITHLVSEPDNGIYDAMNKGVALATGDVVGILNSDDFYSDPQVLSQVMEVFDSDEGGGASVSRARTDEEASVLKTGAPSEVTTISHRSSPAPIDCAYGDLDYVAAVDTNQVVRAWRSGEMRPGAFRRGWHPAHPSFFVRRSVYERFGVFDTALPIAADYEFMLRVLERESLQSVYVPKVLVKMRMGGASNSSIKNIAKANLECWKAWRGTPR